MTHPLTTRTTGRSVFVAGYLVALAAAGEPPWLAGLLGFALVVVWLSPLIMTRGRGRGVARPRPRPRPRLP
jgi:hypothetical protein